MYTREYKIVTAFVYNIIVYENVVSSFIGRPREYRTIVPARRHHVKRPENRDWKLTLSIYIPLKSHLTLLTEPITGKKKSAFIVVNYVIFNLFYPIVGTIVVLL